ncbi:MAG TPA: response regulator transcription factor [Anaerolineales bacterium]|nr:response regulator transcription factor [Anaerolineales bacterium]
MKADLITILIADDHPIVRAGIRTILEEAPDLRVIGEAEDGDTAQKLVAELQPRVLLLDLKMPGLSSAQVEKWVRSNFPDVVTLVLTAHDRDVYLSQMLEAGVSGYMDKNTRGEQLIAAIRRAVNGEMLFSGEQIQRALQWRRQEGSKWHRLTVREREILQHLANGLDNAGISLRLNISQKTVAFHITNILKKLEVVSRQEAATWFNKNIPDDLENFPG